jgi:carboxyl-terminal processing protease
MTITQKNIIYWLIVWIFSFILGVFLERWESSFSFGASEIWYIQKSEQQYSPIYNSKKVQEVYAYIEKYYYWFQSKDKQKMEDSYLSAITSALWDKHTNYFNTVDSEKFIDSLAWDFQGIGAVIQDHRKWIQVVKVLGNSPAQKNKIEAWDIITHVNGDSMLWVPSTDAVNKIRGPKWTIVSLSIISVKDEEKKEIKIQRDNVIVPSVDSKMLTGSIWYVEISMFGESTANDVKNALRDLTLSWAKAFVLDARNNGGGYLDSAVDILSFILEKDMVAVSTKGNNPKDNQIFYTKRTDFNLWNKPLVMLVNAMSASATEITAWALQDYERAIILWETSYGKWSVQTPFPLSDGSLIKITTAKWYTPKERWIDEKWIIPDIEVHFKDEDYKTLYDRQLQWALKVLNLNLKNEKAFKEWKEESLKITF